MLPSLAKGRLGMFRKETRTSKIDVLRFAAAFSAVMMSVCSVFAEEDPYAGYVKLNTADWATTASWRATSEEQVMNEKMYE